MLFSSIFTDNYFIGELKKKHGPEQEVSVIYEDTADNDVQYLFKIIKGGYVYL